MTDTKVFPENSNVWNDSDEDDPVVDEFPIYLSKDLDCHLLQYPVRPATLPYTHTQNPVREVKYRPKNQQLELHMDLNTNNTNYDKSKADLFNGNPESEKGDYSQKSSFKLDVMDKQVLSGGKTTSDTTRYAFGIMQGKELHITEVKSILALRPNLGYLDKLNKKLKAEGKLEDPDDPSEELDTKPEAVTVRFSKGDSDRAAKWRERSYQHMIEKEEEEPWTHMNFHQDGVSGREAEMAKLFCSNREELAVNSAPPPKQYLDLLKN